MRSKRRGKPISPPSVEVVQISPHGIWLFVAETEFFLPFAEYPWFRSATVAAIHNVQLLHGRHLHWPDLDVDLELESLRDPGLYPLVAR